eukprot:3254199-Prorocentrum_lima.AAC.1
MTSSLVGSEMCIRDRKRTLPTGLRLERVRWDGLNTGDLTPEDMGCGSACLLYTSDAADDM